MNKQAPARLKLYRQLDTTQISPALSEHLEKFEDAAEWVDGDRARDLPLTQEILEITKGYALTDQDGNVVARYKKFEAAEAARASAKISIAVDVDVDDDEDAGDEDDDAGDEDSE